MLATSINGNFEANGVLGLSPAGGARSILHRLWESGQIERQIFGLNFENPIDTDQRSVVKIGEVDYDEVEGGEAGINYYSNLAIGKWGLLMDDFMYDDVDMTGDHSAKLAFIDSGNFSIQIPESMFNNLLVSLKKKEQTVFAQKVSGKTILVARKPCEDLYDTLGDIEFALQGTIMMIKPRGYLYHQPFMANDCFFGIESIPNSANQYRLGRVFLRNFYTGLDFENNLIMIGPNAFSSQKAKAYI